MSTPPVNYGALPPGPNRMNFPPPNIPPLLTLPSTPRPGTYEPPMPMYPPVYNQSNYPSSYPYHPYGRTSILPSTDNRYLPLPPPPPYLPPSSIACRNPHYQPKEVYTHVQKESPARFPPANPNITDVLLPPGSYESSTKGQNDYPHFKQASTSRQLSPQLDRKSIYRAEQTRERKLSWERQDRGEYSRERIRSREREQERRELSRNKDYDKHRENLEERRTRDERSRSPSYSSHKHRSPSRYPERERRKPREPRDERQREREKYYEEMKEYERKRQEYQEFRTPVAKDDKRVPKRASTSRKSPSRKSPSRRSPSRRSPSRRSPRRSISRSISSSSGSHRRLRSPTTSSYYSHRDESRSRTRELSHLSRDERERDRSKKPLTDREKILEEYSKNFCRTSEDLIAKMEQWSKEQQPVEEEPKLWYRCSPAELYYKNLEGAPGIEQTKKLEKLLETFFDMLIMRGRNARPTIDELPPLKARPRMCSKHADKSSSSSSSSEESDEIDEDGLQGYTDRIMLELERKQSHPRRLHPEMWFNNPGEMNGGPLCRCSVRARRFGMRHGVYAGEQAFPRCTLTQNNIDKLHHYRITVSPPTNFLIKNPTIIGHDEHEFLFSGFSMFSHYKLAQLPTCKVIRFNIEYTILYVEEPAPENFTVQELDYFEDFLFTELLELVDLDLGKATEASCSQFHFMPRFVRLLAEGGCEVLSMCEVMKYLIDESALLIPPGTLDDVHSMDHYTWQKFVDKIKGMIVTNPGRKPCSVRVDQLDRTPPVTDNKEKDKEVAKKFFPEIVHFGIRPPQLSYAGNPEYQKAWRYYVKYRHLIANMAKPTYKERSRLAAKEAKLQEMRTQSKMKRDVTVAISSEGFHTTGLMCDVVQHAMLIPVLVRHLRFHKSLEALETKIGYVFKQRLLLQTALTHPSYRENFGTNPDHARNSLTNCGIRQPEYGDRRIHYTRKKGIVTLINIMSRFGKRSETESEIKHNERLEFLGDAVVEFLSSIHLFRMFPGLAEGGLATYRASIVQNQHLAQLAKNIELEQFMLYAHGSDLCREVVMKHAMANCFEALMGALFLDAGLQVADRVFALALWCKYPDLFDVWLKERPHPLQEQEPLGDRQYIKDFEFLQRLTEFEKSIGVEFKHIRLLARAFTDRSVGFTHLTLGSNQRLEFLGDTVLQLVVSDRLYRHFPDHHEGHLSLLRSSLVNNRTQSMVCDDLDMSTYAIYNNPKAKPTTKKHKADLLEAFLGALYIDKSLDYCIAFCNACLFPRLQEFIMNQDWNDPKSKLQQCCLTLRSMEGGEPDIPLYKVIECMGPTNTRVYTVGVYFRGVRLASSRGHSIQDAEMNAASVALSNAHELFPQLDHQKRVIAKSMRRKRRDRSDRDRDRDAARYNDRVPKAYRLHRDRDPDRDLDSDSNGNVTDEDVEKIDSGLDSEPESTRSIPSEKIANIEISSLFNDMQKAKAEMIRKNEYDKFKQKCLRSDSDDDE